MTEKIVVEFTVQDGKRDEFLAQLQAADSKDMFAACQGFRADDYVSRREALVKFVDAMELKLRKNDHKTNWRTQPVEALIRLMLLELEEFKVADEFFTVAEARTELTDVSNYALIVYDRLGMLDQTKNRRIQTEREKS